MKLQKLSIFTFFLGVLSSSAPANAGWVLDHYKVEDDSVYERHTKMGQGKDELTYAKGNGFQDRPKGKEVYDSNDPNVYGWEDNAAGATAGVYSTGANSTIGSGSGKLSLTVSPVFKWVGGGEPDKQFFYRETCKYGISNSDGNFAQNGGLDGWGASKYSETNPYNGGLYSITFNRPSVWEQPIAPLSHPTSGASPYAVLSSHSEDECISVLKIKGTETQVIGPVRSFTGSVEQNSVTLGGAYYDYFPSTGGSINVGYTAEVIPLSVSVSRGILPKSASDPTLKKNRDEWVDKDGTGYGHTIHSYDQTISTTEYTSTVEQTNKQTFFAYSTGNWPKPTWSWSPSDVNDTKDQHTQDMEKGNQKLIVTSIPSHSGQEWQGKSGLSKRIITYTKTASSGNKIRAKYNLTVHDPWEIVTFKQQRVEKNPRPVGIAETKKAGEEVTVTATLTKGYSIKAGVTGEFGKDIAALLPILPKINFEYTYTGTTATGSSRKVADLKPNQQTWLEVVDVYDRYSGTANEWNKSGFVAVRPFSIDNPANPPIAMQIHEPYVNVIQEGTGGSGGG